MPTYAVRTPDRRRAVRSMAFAATALALAPGAAAAAPTATELFAVGDARALSAGSGQVAWLTSAPGKDLATDARPAGAYAPQQLQLATDAPGAAPAPAAGVAPLPSWARPHLGTDAAGKAVVTYPRCGAKAASCRLWQYDVASGTGRAVAGVDGPGGELEGVMDGGAVAFTRFAPGQRPRNTLRTTLHFRPAAGKARLVTSAGGEALALRGGRIAQIRDQMPSAGICGLPTVQVITTAGRTVDAASHGCGMEPDTPGTPTFVGGALIWGVSSTQRSDRVVRFDVRTRALSQAPVRGLSPEFVATGGTSGLHLLTGEGAEGEGISGRLERLTQLAFGPLPKQR